MLCELHHLVSRARLLLRELDVDALSGEEARTAVEEFVALEKLAVAGRTLAAGRLAETGAWVGDGSFRDIEAFFASLSGTSVGAARAALGTAQRVKQQPAVSAALRAGALSGAQAEAVSAAVDDDPSTADALVGLAQTAGYRGLKHECERVTAAARSRDDECENYERITRERSLRHHTTRDGSGRIEIRGPLDRTAQIMASLEPLERELFEDHRAGQERVHPEAIAFDAVVRMADAFTRSVGRDDDSPSDPQATKPARTRGSRPLAVVVVHISHAAYQRGWTEPGEICEIEGLGPLPVGVALRLASDAILKAVVVDGVDVTRVAHLGRTIPAHLRTAIEVRDRTCVIEGCEVDRHLEIDHNIPVAAGGLTTLANLGRLCHHHHAQKTLRDLRRAGPLGRQQLVTRNQHQRAGPGP
ncbi:MAG: DUF222 domain-containing protein [Acidimicrobiia bacterium]